MISLGFSNGWKNNTPEIVVKCRAEGHTPEITTINQDCRKYACNKCGYYYHVKTGG